MRISLFFSVFLCVQVFEVGFASEVDPVHLYKTENGPSSTRTPSFIKSFYKGQGILVSGMRSALSSGNLSPTCYQHVRRFTDNVSQFLELPSDNPMNGTYAHVENWALQMLDSWGRLPHGVLSGHVNALGDYDQCLKTITGGFQGKYCLLYIIPDLRRDSELETELRVAAAPERSLENLREILSITIQGEMPVIPSFSSCLPTTCSDKEILIIVAEILGQVNLTPVASFCSSDAEQMRFGTGALITTSILGICAVWVFAATLRNLYEQRKEDDSLGTSTFRDLPILDCFSLQRNLPKFLQTKMGQNDVGCLYGLRFISAAWVVLCHTYMCATRLQPVYNLVDAYTFLTKSSLSAIVSNGAIIVDIFLVIGGFLVPLNLLPILEKSNGKLSLSKLYIRRYLRITPLYGVMILMGTFIFPLLGSGPYWHVAKIWAGFCERNWWKNLLYINNLPLYDTLNDPSDGPCHGLAWYLGVDMQLFLLSPLLLYPVWKWNFCGSLPLAGFTILSAVLPGLITYFNNFLPTTIPFASAASRYSQLAYIPTYMRATPYFIGMCTGLLFHLRKNSKYNTKNATFVYNTVWLATLATIVAVILGPQKFLDSQYHYKPLESGIYVTGHRTAWALAISWIIFACGSGYGGWINSFLSWKPFIPLGRLTFAIYLVSLHLQFLFHLQYRQPIYFGNFFLLNLFISHLVMSVLVAFVFMLLIEAPAMNLLKLFLPQRMSQSTGSKRCKNNSQTVLIGNSTGSIQSCI